MSNPHHKAQAALARCNEKFDAYNSEMLHLAQYELNGLPTSETRISVACRLEDLQEAAEQLREAVKQLPKE